MTDTLKLIYDGKEFELPVIEGSEGEILALSRWTPAMSIPAAAPAQ
jgi:hypothetical protein